MQKLVLETGVDKLVNFVKQKGQVELEEAAKELGVSITVIREWVGFLEDKGAIKFSHTLTKTLIVENELTESKREDFLSKKEILVRKSEVNLHFLRKQGELIQQAKVKFDRLNKYMNSELNAVKAELNEIQNYREQKKHALQQAELQKKESHAKIKSLNHEILRQKDNYDRLLSDFNKEIRILLKEAKQARSIDTNVRRLNKNLAESKKIIEMIEKKVSVKNESLNRSRSNIATLKQMAEELAQLVEKEKILKLDSLKNGKLQEISALDSVNKFMSIISMSNKNFPTSKNVHKRIDNIMNKNTGFLNLLQNIDKEREELKQEYSNLIKRANSLNNNSKQHNLRREIADLREKFYASIKKRIVFDNKFKRLVSFFAN